MSIRDGKYIVEMEDGSKWAVPIEAIALNRAKKYADEFGNNTARSLEEDTWPLFEDDSYEIHDWASNNMNWEEVEGKAARVADGGSIDYQEGWVHGEWEIA